MYEPLVKGNVIVSASIFAEGNIANIVAVRDMPMLAHKIEKWAAAGSRDCKGLVLECSRYDYGRADQQSRRVVGRI